MKLEDKLNELNKLIEDLEKNPIEIDDAIKKYETILSKAKIIAETLKTKEEQIHILKEESTQIQNQLIQE